MKVLRSFLYFVLAIFCVDAYCFSLPNCASGLQLYATNDMQIGDRVTISSSVRADGNLVVGNDGNLNNMYVKGNLTVGDRTIINGSPIVQGQVTSGNGSDVWLDTSKSISTCVLPQISVSSSDSNNVNVGAGMSDTLSDGVYGTVTVQSSGILYMNSGSYQLRGLNAMPGARIIVLGAVQVFVDNGGIAMSDRSSFVGVDPTLRAGILVATNGNMSLGTDIKIWGLWYARNSDVSVQSRSMLQGSLIASTIHVGNDVDSLICARSSYTTYDQANGQFARMANGIATSTISGGVGFHTENYYAESYNYGDVLSGELSVKNIGAYIKLTVPGMFTNGKQIVGANLPIFRNYQVPVNMQVGNGKLIDGVNAFTGKLEYTIPIYTINAPGGETFNFNIKYNSPTPVSFLQPNNESPVSAYGFGWNYEFPFVVTDHKGTAGYGDDVFYANLGQWGGGQLVTSDGSTFHLNNNPYIILTPIGNATNLDGWDVQLPNGEKIILGLRRDAKRMTFVNGSKVDFEPGTTAYSKAPTFAYRWDVSEIRAPLDRSVVRFDWGQIGALPPYDTNSVDNRYTRESWISAVWSGDQQFSIINDTVAWGDYANHGVDSLLFYWGVKDKREVLDDDANGYDYIPSYYLDSRYLDSVVAHAGGSRYCSWNFKYSMSNNTIGTPKRLLSNVYPVYDGDVADVRQWWMDYDTGGVAPSGWLKQMTTPQFVKNTYQFSHADSSAKEQVMDTFSNVGINEDNSACVGEFCYVSDSAQYSSLDVYLRAGKSYKKVFSNSRISGKLYYGDGYFIALDTLGRKVSVYEWHDSEFVKTNPFAGDGRLAASNGHISIAVGNGFFILSCSIQRDVETSDGWYVTHNYMEDGIVIPVVRDSAGTWRSINRNKNSCEANGGDFKYPVAVQFNFNDCIGVEGGFSNVGNVAQISIDAYGDFFALAEKNSGLIAVFKRSSSDRFDNETKLMLPPDGDDVLFSNNAFFRDTSRATLLYGCPISIIANKDMFALTMYTEVDYPGPVYISSISWHWNGDNWIPQAVYNNEDWNHTIYNGGRPEVLRKTSDGFVRITEDGWVDRFRYDFEGGGFAPTNVGQFDEANNAPIVSSTDHYTAVSFVDGNGIPSSSSLFYEQNPIPGGAATLINANAVTPKQLPSILSVSPDEKWILVNYVDASKVGNYSSLSQGNDDVFYYYVPISYNKTVNGGLVDASNVHLIASGIKSLTKNSEYNQYGPNVIVGNGVWLNNYSSHSDMQSIFMPLFSTGPISLNYNLESQMIAGVKKQSLYTNAGTIHDVLTTFKYTADLTDGFAMYNGNVESPKTIVSSIANDVNLTSNESDSFYVQRGYSQLGNSQLSLPGNLRLSVDSSAVDNTVNVLQVDYEKRQNESGWPSACFLITPIRSMHKLVYPNGACQTNYSFQDGFNSANGRPSVVINALGGADNGEYRHHAEKLSFNSNGLVAGLREVMFKDSFMADSLLMTNTGNKLIQSMALNGSAAPINAYEINYDANGRDSLAVWKWAYDPVNVDADFSTGAQVFPHSFDSAWRKTLAITKRSSNGGVVEYLSMPSTAQSKWYVNLHEGQRNQLTASFSGASRNEVAALTAEDGNANSSETYNTDGGRLVDGRWEVSNYWHFDSTVSHTGKWSIRVENNYGPTTNISIDSLLSRGDGIYASGWAYSEGSTPPVLLVQYWKNGCAGDSAHCITGDTFANVAGGYKPGVWQHWIVNVSYNQLKQRAPEPHQYARIFFGVYGEGTKVWVDDLQIAPTNAALSSNLYTYNAQGRLTATMSMNGDEAINNYDRKGNLTSTSDSRGRIFSQSALIRAGDK